MKDHERDDLFSRARREGAPTDDDRRRVRAALTRKLGVVAAVGVGATATKAAASMAPAATAVVTSATAGATVVATGVTALAIAKVSAVVIAVAAVGYAVLPAKPSTSASQATVAVETPMAKTTAAERPELQTALPSSRVPPALEAVPPPPAAETHVESRPMPSVLATPAPRTLNPLPAQPVVVTTAPSATSESDARDEVALVTAMQVALRAGDPAHVLELVREHERRFPTSALAPEREGARVLSLCPGRAADEAARLGQAFLDAHPLSPLGARVRATCGVR